LVGTAVVGGRRSSRVEGTGVSLRVLRLGGLDARAWLGSDCRGWVGAETAGLRALTWGFPGVGRVRRSDVR